MTVSEETKKHIARGVNRPGDEDQIRARAKERLRRLAASEENLRDLIGRDSTTKTHAKALEERIEEYEVEREAIYARWPELEGEG